MDSTLSQRLGRGIASSVLGQLIASVNAILLVPLFIHAWSVEGYGRWLALTALISYLSLLDLGGQSYIGNLLATLHLKGDTAEFHRVLSSGVSLFGLFSVCMFFLILLFVIWPDLSFPGEGRKMLYNERIVLLCMSTLLLITIPAGVYVTVYRSTGLFVRASMLGNLASLLLLALSAGLLIARVDPPLYAISMLIFGIGRTLFIVWDAQRHIPASRGIHLGLYEAKMGRAYLRGSLYFWLLALGSAINQQGIVLVLSVISTPVAVAMFVTHRTAGGLLGYIGNLIRGPLWPEFSFLWARERYAEIEQAVVLLTGTMMLVTGLAGIALYLFLPNIYPIWTGRELSFNLPLFSIIVLQGTLAVGWLMPSLCLMATNQHKDLALWTLANATISVMLAVFLVRVWGATGAALASLIGDLVCTMFVVPWLAGKHLRISTWHLYKTMILSTLVLTFFAVSAIALSNFLSSLMALVLFSLLAIGLGYPALIVILGHHATKQLSTNLYAAVTALAQRDRLLPN